MSNSLNRDFERLLTLTRETKRAGRLLEAQRAADELLDAVATLTHRDRATAYFAAATVASERGDPRTAIRHYTTVLDELDRVDAANDSDDDILPLWLAKGRAHFFLGETYFVNRDPDRGRQSYRSAIQEADVIAESRRGWVQDALRMATKWRMGLLKRDRDAAQTGLVDASESQRTCTTLLRQASKDVARLAAMGERAQAHDLRVDIVVAADLVAGDLYSKEAFGRMLDVLQPGLEHARALADTSNDATNLPIVVHYLSLLAEAFIGLERSDEAIPHLERAVDLARSVGDRGSPASVMAEAVHVLEARLEMARSSE